MPDSEKVTIEPPATAPTPAPTPVPAPSPAPAPAPAEDAVKAEAAALKKQLEAQKKELEAYKAKEQAELDKQKSAEEKLAEKEAEIERIKRENLVTKLAAKKGLDPDLFDRVRGATEDEIAADIDLLLEKFKVAETASGEPKGKKTQTGTPAATSVKKDPTNILEERNENFLAWRKTALAGN